MSIVRGATWPAFPLYFNHHMRGTPDLKFRTVLNTKLVLGSLESFGSRVHLCASLSDPMKIGNKRMNGIIQVAVVCLPQKRNIN